MSDDNRIDKVTGQVKETAGKAIGDGELENEGKAQRGIAQAKEAVDDAVHKVGGAVKRAANKATGSDSE